MQPRRRHEVALRFTFGIPFAIRAGVVDHRNPLDGDRGIQFEPTEEAAVVASSWRASR